MMLAWRHDIVIDSSSEIVPDKWSIDHFRSTIKPVVLAAGISRRSFLNLFHHAVALPILAA
jgi:hypothetical protein